MALLIWIVFVAAAVLEVSGDALIRWGLHGGRWPYILAGMMVLGGYGLLVNQIRWDFSRLLGVYVGVFALISVLAGKWVLREHVPLSVWVGLSLIIVGGLIIQFGKGF
jgi:drug/metabolite transporter superfamily protein YnfA